MITNCTEEADSCKISYRFVINYYTYAVSLLISVENQLHADGITAMALIKHAIVTRTPTHVFYKLWSSLRQTSPIYLSGTAGGMRG